MRPQPFAIIVLLSTVVGFGFAAVSTYDSTAHLDRQVHGIHCSYLLGAGQADTTGSSGCYATLMSPYSSVFRNAVWGGIPVALAGMSVFAFIFFWTVWMLSRRAFDVRAAGFLWLATALPLLTSIVMGYLAIVDLDAICKMCMGIYLASGGAFIGAGLVFWAARKAAVIEDRAESSGPRTSWQLLVAAFALGVGFVGVPFGAYGALAPDFSPYVGNCGTLQTSRDADGVLIPYGPQERDVEMIEVLDPLCQACGMLERRMADMQEMASVNRKVLLFPLDSTCNWMVDEAIHPGACAVSEAVICADDKAAEVLDWAMAHQTEILESAQRDTEAPGRMVTSAFPGLKSCVGSAAVRAKLNLSLRWAVKNQLQVLTPQIFVRGLRLCDEDTDLGLDFALSRLIARAKAAPARPRTEAAEPTPAPAPKPVRIRDKKPEPERPEASPPSSPSSPSPPSPTPTKEGETLESKGYRSAEPPVEGKVAPEPAVEPAPATAPEKVEPQPAADTPKAGVPAPSVPEAAPEAPKPGTPPKPEPTPEPVRTPEPAPTKEVTP